MSECPRVGVGDSLFGCTGFLRTSRYGQGIVHAFFLCAKLPNTARKLCHQCPLAAPWQSKEPTRTNAFLAYPTKKHYLCKAEKTKSNNYVLINNLRWKTNLHFPLFVVLPLWWQHVPPTKRKVRYIGVAWLSTTYIISVSYRIIDPKTKSALRVHSMFILC